MTSMDMSAFDEAYSRSLENNGVNYGDVSKLTVRNGLTIRLIGSMASAWEHFVETAKGVRPMYCLGPQSDCPVCSLCAQWSMSDDPDLQKRGDDMRAKEKYYFNVLDRSDAGRKWHAENKKSYVLTQNEKGFNIGPMILQAIGAICSMRKSQGKPHNPNGFDIQLSKTGTKMQTRYGAQFTGDDTPLTEEEQAYELCDLGALAALTPTADVDAIVQYLSGASSSSHHQDTSFDVSRMASSPADVTRQAMGGGYTPPSQPASPGPVSFKPAAAQRAPAMAPAPARPPQRPAAAAPTPPAGNYASTVVTADYDPKSAYQVPCGSCGVMMQISHTDTRDLQCHGCGKVYSHPSNS